MIELPNWLEIKIDTEFSCPSCDGKMSKEFVTAFGIRESTRDPNVKVCWIEYNCMLCSKKSHIEICPYTIRLDVCICWFRSTQALASQSTR